MTHQPVIRLLAGLLLAVLTLSACDTGRSPAEQSHHHDDQAMRVVSLAPALTQMVVDLGMDHTLVGVGEHDAAAPAGLPVVGHFLDVNIEALLAVNPTHVLMMVGRTPPPPLIEQLARSGRFTLVTYPVPRDVEDVARILFDEQTDLSLTGEQTQPSLGMVMGVPRRARQVKYEMLMRLGALAALTDRRERPRVLVVIGTNPLMASGPGTVSDHLLRFAGARNAAEDATVGAPVYDRETLVTLVRPDVVLVMAPGAPPLGTMDRDDRLAIFRGLNLPAVEHERFVLIDDPLAQLPSSALPRVAAAMTKAIHPDLTEQVDQVMASEPGDLLGPVNNHESPNVSTPADSLDQPGGIGDDPS